MTDTETMTAPERKDMLETPEPDVLTVDSLRADMTAIGATDTKDLTARQSAIGSATVEKDASLHSSAVGMLTTHDSELHQSVAAAVMAEGDVTVSQGPVGLITAQRVEIHDGGAGVLIANEASVARSWVGVAVAREVSVSDDSRVLIDTRAALIIGAALLGGFGLMAVAAVLGARRVARSMPHLPHIEAPDLSVLQGVPQRIVDAIAQLRKAV